MPSSGSSPLRRGPLASVRVLELASIGPVPFCGMLLSDLGAEVLRLDRPGTGPVIEGPTADRVVDRGRRSLVVDLARPAGRQVLLDLVERVDVLLEGYRPGVAERLGIGPAPCLERNPRLVYARLSGFGREGPFAPRAGHDIDFVALSGALDAIGRRGSSPVPPLNLVGDNGGGLLLAYGIACALFERAVSGRGQVVDTALVDAAALLATPFYALRALGAWSDERGTNLIDSGAPFYDVYETADGRYLAVGAVEERFYREFLDGLGLGDTPLPDRWDKQAWPALAERFAAAVRARTLEEWLEVFADRDACIAPVLRLSEAPAHPHHRARGAFATIDGVPQPVPALRFSRTPGALPPPGPVPGEGGLAVLERWGLEPSAIERLVREGTVAGTREEPAAPATEEPAAGTGARRAAREGRR
jgi:alpha-methylacyl-CoA racemase